MNRTFRNILSTVGIVICCTLLVAGMLFAAVQSSRVQTAAVGVFVRQLESALKTHAQVAEVDYKFPNKLLIHGVYLEDQLGDTLLYADTIQARFDMLALLREGKVSFRNASLLHARGYAHTIYQETDSLTLDSVMNYQFLVDAFRSEDTESKPFPLTLEVKNVSLVDMRVQYDGWLVDRVNANLALNHFSADSLDAEVDHFSFDLRHCDKTRNAGGAPLSNETPFSVEALRARVLLVDSVFTLPEVFVSTAESRFCATDVQVRIGQSLRSGSSPVRFNMQDAHLTPRDISFFVPQWRSFRGYVDAHANLDGRVDSLHMAELSFRYNGQRLLLGDVTAFGLPNLDSAYIKAQCQDFFINKGLLQDLISNLRGHPYQLPNLVARLGDVHYRGTLSGRLNDLTLHGVFTSALGSITTNGHAITDRTFSELTFSGDVATQHFALGTLLANSDLGAASLTVHVNGHVKENHPFHGQVCANVDQLVYRKYKYRNLHLDGAFSNKLFEGELGSKDDNLNFAFNGRMDFSTAHPEVDFLLKLNHFRPGYLNLTDKYADADLRFTTRLQAAGSSVDNVLGQLNIDTLVFTHNGKTLRMKSLELTSEHGTSLTSPDGRTTATDKITLSSDYLSASVFGQFRLSTMPITLQKLLIRYIPQLYSEQQRRDILAAKSQNDLELSAYFHNLTAIYDMFDLPLTMDEVPIIKGFVHESTNQISLKAFAPDLLLSGQHLEDLSINLDNTREQINLTMSVFRHHANNPASRHMGDMKIFLGAYAKGDSLNTSLDWSNVEDIHNAGALRLATTFRQYAGHPLIELHIKPTDILLGDSIWHVADSRLTYTVADTALVVDGFSISSNSQYLKASGVASTRGSDMIRAELRNIDLDYFLGALTDVKKSINFGGHVTGWATAFNLFREPKFEADVEMMHAKINQVEIGDIYASARLDSRNHVIINGRCMERFASDGSSLMHLPDSIAASTPSRERQMVNVYGDIGGEHGNWDLQIQVDSVRMGFVGYWVDGILADMDGRASGNVHVYGYKAGTPVTRVTVQAKAHEVGFTLPFTGARYYVSDSVIMDTTSIVFNQIKAHDEDGHPLYIDGGVWHDGDFTNLTFRFDVNVDKAIAMDLPETSENLYSGKIYASGDVQVRGDDKGCRVDARARTEAGSTVCIMAGGASSAAESDFIRFVDHSQDNPAALPVKKETTNPFALSLNLQIEATPGVLARVVIDPRTGDQLRGRGNGNIRLDYNDGKFNMFGGLTLQQGTFSFTLQNVIRREFEIASGSSVTWIGIAESPIIDVRALYHLTASLRDLYGTESSQSFTNRSSVPVNCVLNLSGVLDNPLIRFGIELPSSDESVQSQIRSVINTEDMLTRQVLYLLVFNRFYTPEYLQNTQNVGLNETYSLISSTVTGQINNWLGKVTDAFTLGFNFRTDGEGEAASQEYEAQFEIHPVRGLLINGNFGYRYNDIANQPVFGNLDIEYMLTRDGKLRARAYTHTVDRYSLRQASTIQGVGLVFKHDFNWPTSKERRAGKDAPSAAPSDSLRTGDTLRIEADHP